MKKYFFVILIGICLSCKNDEKYTINSLFLEKLKETSEFYETNSKSTLEILKQKTEEMGYGKGKFDTLKIISDKVDRLFIELSQKEKEEQIKLQQQTLQSILTAK